ncbi:MAG: type II secretion system minor pseudopilin GspK [Nitrospinae bacterium]|nr:type II secretion system minor pseudopilin GspK [Nitrospinota bacterium]
MRKNNASLGCLRGQDGVALLISLLVVVILTVTVTEFLYSAWVDRSFAFGFRDSAKALYALRSAVEASKKIVADDLKNDMKNNQLVDTLKEPWAQPGFPVPVDDTYMFLTITDESSKLDLNRLVTAGGYTDQRWLDAFSRLLRNLQLDQSISLYVLNWISASDDGPAKTPYYASLPRPYKCKNAKLDSLEELKRVKGITPEVFEKIKNFVSIKSSGYVNVNTAPKEVLMSLSDDLTDGLADALIATRTNTPFGSKEGIQSVSGFAAIFPKISNMIGVNTNSFSVSVSVTINEVTRKATALLSPRTTTDATVVFFKVN